MKAIYLNVKENQPPKVVEIEDSLDTFYKLIGCELIEIPMIKIGNRIYHLICDESGLLKENPITSVVNTTYQQLIVGNILLVSGDITDDGNLIGLNDEDIKIIYQNVIFCADRLNPILKGHFVIKAN